MRVNASFLLLLSLVGCDEEVLYEGGTDEPYDEYDEASEAGERAQGGEISHGMTPSAMGPPAQRYLALMPADQGCPEVTGWSSRPLFHLTDSARTAWATWTENGGSLPPILARFCVYTTESPPETPPHVPGSVRVDPDLAVVVPQAGPIPSVPQARADHLLAQLGASPNGLNQLGSAPYLGDPDGLPYVAVVDTADSTPPGVATPYSNPSMWAEPQRHGLSMAALIDTTRCPSSEPACLSRQYRVQAFPFATAQAEPEPAAAGGQWSSLGSLASALGEALAGWRARPDSAFAPLILNLSVGWDPAHGTIPFNHELLLDPNNPNANVPATVQAVHSALAWASCQGVTTVAASGNTRGGGCSETGPLAPASWEMLPPVSASVCAAIAGSSGLPTHLLPLTRGAGGALDVEGPLGNTRLGSLPTRVLYSHQAVVAIGGGHTEAMTGSSVAAAAFSSLIAVVHSHLPEMTAGSVVAAIDALGVPSTIDVDWLQPEVALARRLTFDTVFLGTVGPSGPYQGFGPDRIEDAIAHDIFSQYQMAADPTLIELDPDESTVSGCGPVVLTAALAPDTEGAPPATPRTDELRPQPHVPICPTCPVLNNNRTRNGGTGSPSFTLYLRIDPAYDASDISHATLAFADRTTWTGLQVTLPASYVNVPVAVIDLTRSQLPDGTTVSDWLTSHQSVGSGHLSFLVEGDAGPQPVRQVVDVVR
ncbi:MAG: hypothetical protein KUG77_14700 [Nannocystaceae bacterium]|nr:hypothetical protein [Nannocystaceae bacterium]